MADLTPIRRFVELTGGLAVLSVVRDDGQVASSLVNAGLVDHPGGGGAVVGLVVRGDARKVGHLRRRPHATLVWPSGWRWVGTSGPVELAGPDDPLPGLAPDQLPPLLRDVFRGAGGTHDDWPTYDQVMAQERRLAVLVRPERVYGNHQGG
jgi:PPOX class probable F420-dependent enzyme